MKILGIADHIISGAAIIEDGRVLAAVNEERLVRKKMVMGFPRKSIAAVLALSNTRPEEVDYVAVASRQGHFLNEYVSFDEGLFGVDRGLVKNLFFSIGSKLSFLREKVPVLENLYYDLRKPVYAHRQREIRRIMKEEFGLPCPVEFIEHHFAHACSAFYSSGYPDALVATLDGSGDGSSSLVYEVKDGRWHRLHQVRGFDSLGNYYAYVTQICGFKAGKHEGKITGLAAHGKDRYREILSRFIEYRDGTMVNVGNTWYTEAVKKLGAALPKDFDKADLAATIQLLAEEITNRYIGYWRNKTGQRHVALAGGVFANVRINQRVHELPGVESLFIHPAMSDEGLPLGAALALAYQKSPDPVRLNRRCFETVYLGPDFSDREIEKALDAEGVPHNVPANAEEEIARLIAEGYVVARVSGRMEYGPRALGNRSILYRPDEPEVNNWLNKNLKRTEFMPFAPSTLYEEADRCYRNVEGARDAARFMTITFDCTPEMKKTCAGVVHVDGTARPQLVRERDNPGYYRIIKAFKERTGLPSIVNTSFNIHEEPIVCSPGDAIRAFKEGHLDVLAIGPFIAMNPEAPRRVRERNVERKTYTV
ncbi:MAG TPA: carbamoyltransferase C-terminal domain-containing protein [Nitrospiria bacterium]|nr:carbamoyltransferase C-terminal domain-containing protein [Nitrospiria bacterium]